MWSLARFRRASCETEWTRREEAARGGCEQLEVTSGDGKWRRPQSEVDEVTAGYPVRVDTAEIRDDFRPAEDVCGARDERDADFL